MDARLFLLMREKVNLTRHISCFMSATTCTYLLKFVGNHCKSLKDGVCWSSDCDDPFWTVALRNIDSCSTLDANK